MGDKLQAAVVGADMAVQGQQAGQPRQQAVVEKEHRSPIAAPARSATIVAVVILDSIGVVVTIVATVVLMLNDGINRTWWWLAVGAAFLLAVLTTVLLIRSWLRRQSFVETSKALAAQLDGLTLDANGRPPQPPLLDLADAARKAAQASGDLAEEIRLTTALARLGRFS
jgi:hypothetical protein